MFHIFNFFRVNGVEHVIINCKVYMFNPLQNKPNDAKTKTLFKSQKFTNLTHHFLRIPVIFDVMFLFGPKKPF